MRATEKGFLSKSAVVSRPNRALEITFYVYVYVYSPLSSTSYKLNGNAVQYYRSNV